MTEIDHSLLSILGRIWSFPLPWRKGFSWSRVVDDLWVSNMWFNILHRVRASMTFMVHMKLIFPNFYPTLNYPETKLQTHLVRLMTFNKLTSSAEL